MRRRSRFAVLNLDSLEERSLPSIAGDAFVAQAYKDLLGREAEPAGLAYWSALLESSGTRGQVGLGIATSAEYRGNLVENLYGALLGRTSDTAGKSYFIESLAAGSTVEQAKSVFLGSPEYLAVRGGGDPSRYLDALYQDVLGRDVDARGRSTFLAALAQGISPAHVADAVLTSEEGRHVLVQDLYRSLLGRPGEAAGAVYWVALLRQGQRFEHIVAGFLDSQEYFTRSQNPPSPPAVDSEAPRIDLFELAEPSDTPPLGDRRTGRSLVALLGRTEANALVVLTPGGRTARADGDGRFRFDNLPLVVGANAFTVRATDAAGNQSGPVTRTFTLELAPPPSPPDLKDESDTGDSATDNLSNDVTPTFRVQGIAGSIAQIFVDGHLAGERGIPPGSAFVDLTSSAIPEGTHVIQAKTIDPLGAESELSGPLVITIDTIGHALVLELSAASGNAGQTTAGRVTLVGRTVASARVTFVGAEQTTISDIDGSYFFTGVTVAVGTNILQSRVADSAGNVTTATLPVERLASPQPRDEVLRWNEAVLDAVVRDSSTPPTASRAMAMVHSALFDAVSSIEGTPGIFVSQTAPAGTSVAAAVATAGHRVLSYLYPAQQSAFDALLSESLAQVPESASRSNGASLGQGIAETIIALRREDGWDDFVEFVPGNEAGDWQPTPPVFDIALQPRFASLEPFAMESPDQFLPSGPPALDSTAWAAAFNEVKDIGRFNSTTRTAEQTEIARFWADGKGTVTPAGHWNQIAAEAALRQSNSLSENARLFALLNLAMADAAILCWNAKYTYEFWRPVTAILNADRDGNDETHPDPTWLPLVVTPNFPEYTSGHSTFSGAAATILTAFLGNNAAFTTGSMVLPTVQRSFTSFDHAAQEAAASRLYGGIHFTFSNADGLASGRALGDRILGRFSALADTLPPRIIVAQASGATGPANLVVTGQALDNLAGVAALEVAIDPGPMPAFAPLELDPQSRFSYATTFARDGSADGLHTLLFRARDAAGNQSTPLPFTFTLDTTAPQFTLSSPPDGAAIDLGVSLAGAVDGTSSPIVELTYRLDDGPAHSIPFATTGEFEAVPDLSRLGAGSHTLTVTTRDAAGLLATQSRTVNLAAPIPFTIARVTPQDGSRDVGATFRPQVFFSRPVNPASLTSANFFVADDGGQKVPANIVSADDGSFAWLFFQQPLPGGALLHVSVDGASIQARLDGTALDADGNGAPGGVFQYAFTTVSLSPVLGTSLFGVVADPGPDLKPGTFDDQRAGPDLVLMTADDVYLLPLAGVKVHILGLESLAVATDAQGRFTLPDVPTGNVKLAVDGLTATNAPAGVYFPEMVMDLSIRPGIRNTVMAAMEPDPQRALFLVDPGVHLPRLERSILQTIGGSEPNTIGLSPRSAPNLTPEQRALLTIEVQPGTLIDAAGGRVGNGQVGISTVPPELVRDMLPPGLLQHTFDITVQAPGTTNFTTPAPMTFPNVFDAAPGSQLNFLSFDHTTGRLVIEGTATVSADGLSVRTNPGVGITHPGWHGMTPPGSETVSENPICDPAQVVEPIPDIGLREFGPVRQAVLGTSRTISQTPLKNLLFLSDQDEFGLYFRNKAMQPASGDASCNAVTPMVVTVDVEGKKAPEDQFLEGIGMMSGRAHYETKVLPGKVEKIDLGIRDVPADELRAYGDKGRNVLWGASLHILAKREGSAQVLFDKTIHVYRFLDTTDIDPNDATISFEDTLVDGTVNASREKFFDLRMPILSLPDFSTTGPDRDSFDALRASGDSALVAFDPRRVGENQTADLILTPQDGTPLQSPRIHLLGDATPVNQVFLDKEKLKSVLKGIAEGSAPQTVRVIRTGDTGTFELFVGPDQAQVPMNATAAQVQAALLALPFFAGHGPDAVSVSATDETTNVNRGGKQVALTRVTYTISFGGNPAVVAVPLLRAESLDPDFDSSATIPHVSRVLITDNEIMQFDTEPERNAIADAVENGLKDRFANNSDALKFVNSVAPADRARTIALLWETRFEDISRFGTSAPTPADDGVDTSALILDAVARRSQFSKSGQNFLLADAMNQSYDTGVAVYVDNHLEYSQSGEPFELTGAQFVNGLIGTTAHEVGHTLGLIHTAQAAALSYPAGARNEIQSFALLGALNPDRFRLVFNGYKTGELTRPASAADVQAALASLPNLANSDPNLTNILVSSVGERYTVEFINELIVIDVPQITIEITHFSTPNGVGSGEVTVQDGLGDEVFAERGGNVLEIRKGGSALGRFDIMFGGHLDLENRLSFISPLSLEALKVGLKVDWTIAEAQLVLRYLTRQAQLGGGSFFSGVGGDPQGDGPPIPGPALGMIDEQDELVGRTIEFGSIRADGAGGIQGAKTLTFFNFGSEDLVVQTLEIANPRGIFSRAGDLASGKVLKPGGSANLILTFDPLASGEFRADVLLNTSDPQAPTRITLTGFGVSPDGDLRVTAPNNNAGGQRLGDGPVTLENFLTLSNVGGGALTIASVGVDELSLGQYRIAGLPAGPLALGPGESFAVGLTFDPSRIGLQLGQLQVASSDPDTPLFRQPIIGTGLADSGNALRLADSFVAVETAVAPNSPVLRRRADDRGHWSFFLPQETAFHAALFDPFSGLIAHQRSVTESSGQRTAVGPPSFLASTVPDSDGDGLPDDIEFAIGTSTSRMDTDGDGLSDFAAVAQGVNPLGGRAFPTGVVAAARLRGDARELVVERSPVDPDRQLAYVATGAHGLAIVDVSRFDNPIVLGQLDLPGDNRDVAVDLQRGLVAVAGGSAGLHLIDVSDPAVPILRQTVFLPSGATHVEAYDGLAFAASGNSLVSIDVLTGELGQVVSPGTAALTGLAREGATLFTMDAGLKLRAVDIAGLSLVQRGQLVLPDGGGTLFVGNGIVYAAATSNPAGGFATVDVGDRDALALLSGSDVSPALGLAGAAFATNGSGLGAMVGRTSGGINAFDLFNTSDLASTAAFLTRFVLPTAPQSVVLTSGLAFVAAGSSGLQIVNCREFDTEGTPPTIAITSPAVDVSAGAPGVQVPEGAALSIRVEATDDVQVSRVEFFVNGALAGTDLSFPFEGFAIAPSDSSQVPQVVVVARAFDTGGNSTRSNRLVFELIPDTSPPAVQTIAPADGADVAPGLRTIRIDFSEPLALASLQRANFQLRDDAAQIVAMQNIGLRNGDRSVQLTYAGLPVGAYALTIDVSEITDRAGNPMGGPDIVSRFEAVGATIFWSSPTGGAWHNPANWSTGVLPAANDDVVIAVPGDVVIALDKFDDSYTVKTLRSNNRISMTDTTLTVTGVANFAGGLDLNMVGSTRLNLPGGGTVSGASAWTGGTITGALTNTGVLTLSGTTLSGGINLKLLGEAVPGALNNLGVIDQRGSSTVSLGNGTLNNLAGAVYDLESTGRILTVAFPTGPTLVTNAGTIRKSVDAGMAEIRAPLNNSATVEAPAGELRLSLGGANTNAHYQVSGGATLHFSGGTHTLAGTTTFSGSGTVLLDNSALAVGAGGEATVSAATTLQISSGGTLTKTGSLIAAGVTNWTGGTLNGAGSFINQGTLNITGSGNRPFFGVLNNQGTIVHSGTGSLTSNGATIANQAGAIYDLQSTGSLFASGSSAFNNAGALLKSAGSGQAEIGGTFTNTGTVDVRSGTLRFTGSFTQTSGATRLQGGNLTGNSFAIQGGMLEGGGTITGSVTNAGTVRIGLSPGSLSITQSYTQTAAGVLHIEVGGLAAGTQFDRLAVGVVATLNGTLNVSLIDGFEPAVGDAFPILTFASRNGAFATIDGLNLPNGKVFSLQLTSTSATLQTVSALRALAEGDGRLVAEPILSLAQAAPVLHEAVAFWMGLGLDEKAGDALKQVELRVADLHGALLAHAVNATITLDQDAARHGWFLGDARSEVPRDKIDLLTVLSHELGHVIGLDDQTEELMSSFLQAGTRVLPSKRELDWLFGQSADEVTIGLGAADDDPLAF